MTKLFNVGLSALSIGFAILLSTGADAGSNDGLDRSLRIRNSSSQDMVEFYASNKGTGNWEEDILGLDVLRAGRSMTVNIDDGSGYCRYDFKAVFSDGSVKTDWGVNVCAISSFRYR